MEKIKRIFGCFLLSELVIIIAITFEFLFINNNSSGWFFIFIIGSYIFYASKWNLILTFIFYFINESINKIISFIIIIIFSCFLIYLLYKRNYYEGLSIDYYNYHKKYQIVFLITHIGDIIIWLYLIINQLLVDFYYMIWQKMKRVWKK